MVLSIAVPMIRRLASLNPQWNNEDLETFAHYWLLIMNM
jgi:hypothetical protein